MSELDVAKEKIAYLKVWLGILVITDVSTFGWLISSIGTASADERPASCFIDRRCSRAGGC